MAKRKKDRFRQVIKRIKHDTSGRTIIESIPIKYRKRYLEKQKKSRKHSRRRGLLIRAYDPRVYLFKYYPWCYKSYIPTLVLQGWYSVEIARKAYKRVYGKNSLKYVRFIRGKEALERDFAIGKNLYINGNWVTALGKHTFYRTPYLSKSGYAHRLAVLTHTNNGRYSEYLRNKQMAYDHYTRRFIPMVGTKESNRLSQIQEANKKISESLYEIPDEYKRETNGSKIPEYTKKGKPR